MRALLFAFMAKGKSTIVHPLFSQDTEYMCQAIRLLGGKVTLCEDRIEVIGCEGKIEQAEDVIFSGNSGLIFRFMSAIASLGSYPIVITGDHSIRHQRPITALLEGLKQLSVEAYSTRKEGGAPIIVKGPLQGGKATICGEDSQPVSALLIAAAFAEKDKIELHIQNPGEKPWVDLTLSWFDRLKIAYEREDYSYFCLRKKASCQGFTYKVPGDISSSLFPIAAALITESEIVIENIDLSDAQGDKKCIELLVKLGAVIEYEEEKKRLFVKKSEKLKGGEIDVNPFIDALPILTALSCFSQEKTRLIGGKVARKKECDRIHAIAKELSKMGAHIIEEEEGLTIFPSTLHGAFLSSHNDHRIVMALSCAALKAQGDCQFDNTFCVEKSYPHFFKDLACFRKQKIG